ncbi:hypothetical protein HYU18_01735 [Candidatus Woesearchaeota archaeon]|nr:hypothetical protein [Candidatus Woesearchaeota archaeon]
MVLLTLFFGFVGLLIGFFIGKYIYDKIKWSDKRQALDAEWKLKIESLANTYKSHILQIQTDNEINIKNLVHSWELKYSTDLSEIKGLIQSAEKYMRYDAIRRSKRTLLGKLWEQVSPYLPKFPFRPSDMKFLGSPIDFIIFDGASENDIKQVIFLEVKTGDSRLSIQEKKLKHAIESGKVSWKMFNVEKPDEVRIQEEEDKNEIKGEIPPQEIYVTIDEKLSALKKENAEANLRN